MPLPKIAITIGDAAGIGPELAVLAAVHFRSEAEIILYGPYPFTKTVCERFAPGIPIARVQTGLLSKTDFIPGKDQAVCGKAALDALDQAVKDVLSGKADAIVTAPMSKHAVNLAGIPFQGHTERIAAACAVDSFAMMQSSGSLRVAFATTHIPIREVSQALSPERISAVIRMLHETLRLEGISDPLIGVAALNPHGGEGGFLGNEEEEIIRPALEAVQRSGIRVEGPLVPDVLFIERVRIRYDGIVSMYHDQGHIPFKMLAFETGVNSTLGLPIIRTSPDHGTAYDLIHANLRPNTGSLFAAVSTAIKRAENRQKPLEFL